LIFQISYEGRSNKRLEEDYIMRSFISLLSIKYYYGEQMKKDEMDGTCSTYGKDEKCIRSFSLETSSWEN
jgi:hypothetical protein